MLHDEPTIFDETRKHIDSIIDTAFIITVGVSLVILSFCF